MNGYLFMVIMAILIGFYGVIVGTIMWLKDKSLDNHKKDIGRLNRNW